MMTKTKELSINNPILNVNLIDFLRFIDPSGKSKYVDLMYRLFIGKRLSVETNSKEVFVNRLKDYGLSSDKLKNYDVQSLTLFYYFFDLFVNQRDYVLIKELCELQDRKLLNIDLGQIKSFEDLSNTVTLHSIKKYLKDSEKSIKIIHRDNKWLALKPLSLQSSMKYGGGTKWCTTSPDGYQFYRYSKNGILIYIINLETGNKYGFFHSTIHSEPETSFWNTIDQRVDSMETEIDGYVLDVIRNDIKMKITNFEQFSREEIELYQKNQDNNEIAPAILEQQPMADHADYDEEVWTIQDPPNSITIPNMGSNITLGDGTISLVEINTVNR